MRFIPIFLLLSGCITFGNLPDNGGTAFSDLPLWDAEHIVARADGAYLSLPYTAGLVRVSADGEPSYVDLGDAYLENIAAAPDEQTAVATLQRIACAPEDEDDLKGMKEVSDCDYRDRVISRALGIVRDGAVGLEVPLDASTSKLQLDTAATIAIGWFDLSASESPGAFVDLNSITIIDLASGTTQRLPVGFAAETVQFVENPDGSATKALVLSRNQLAVVDLSGPPSVDTTFRLTLDADERVTPIAVSLTPNGQYALVAVENQAELYVLDLVGKTINLIELSGVPSDMYVDAVNDVSILVYNQRKVVEVLDHSVFDLRSFALDQGMNEITPLADGVLLSLAARTGGGDVVRFDPITGERKEMRLENSLLSLSVSPDSTYAVAFTQPNGGSSLVDRTFGLEVLDLITYKTRPYLLDGAGVGLAWSEGAEGPEVLVLQDNVSTLYQLSLASGLAEPIEVSAPPVAISALPGGPFVITHDDPLGLVSLLDPADGSLTEVADFASHGLLDPMLLSTPKVD